MTNKIAIVKVGGAVLEDPQRRDIFLNNFLDIKIPKILIHGGGLLANTLANRLGIPVQMNDGRRITDKEMLDIVTMVYGGKISKELAAFLSTHGCPAMGLSGADLQIVKSKKRPTTPIDYGFVGDVVEVNFQALSQLLTAGICPIIAPLSCDDQGQILNTNADTVATEIAKSFSRNDFDVILYFTMDLDGVLTDKNNPSSLVSKLNPEQKDHLCKSGAIQGGMIPKLENCFAAKKTGTSEVYICKPEALSSLNNFRPNICTEIVL